MIFSSGAAGRRSANMLPRKYDTAASVLSAARFTRALADAAGCGDDYRRELRWPHASDIKMTPGGAA